MGDLLLIVLWPLVAQKAFARRAGMFAALGTTGCALTLGVGFYLDALNVAIPAMVFIAPVILVQYLLFRRHYRTERTSGDYEAATSVDAPAHITPPTTPIVDLTAALALTGASDGQPGRYVAVHNGVVIGTGPTPGEATMAASGTVPGVTPVLVLSKHKEWTLPDLTSIKAPNMIDER
jgi:hypothetical protein